VDEARIEQAAADAARHADARPDAVLPVRTTRGRALFACAFARPERHVWLVIDDDGVIITDRQLVGDTAELVAMCETAEEACAMLAAGDADAILARAAALAAAAADNDTLVAVRATREAIAPVVREPAVIRVAELAYLDRVAHAAEVIGDRFDLLKETALAASGRLSGAPGDPREPLAEALWDAVRTLARDGAPDRFREMIEGGMGAAAAFALDVIDNYLVALEETHW
jgi:hypothetical protein